MNLLQLSESQGYHRSARFEFPDFFAWNPEQSEENFAPATTGFLQKICLEIMDKLWVTSARLFSLTFPDSRQKILKFPDFPEGQNFPWFSLMVATLSHSINFWGKCLWMTSKKLELNDSMDKQQIEVFKYGYLQTTVLEALSRSYYNLDHKDLLAPFQH